MRALVAGDSAQRIGCGSCSAGPSRTGKAFSPFIRKNKILLGKKGGPGGPPFAVGGFIGAERAYDGPPDAPPLYDKPLLRERETAQV